MKIVLEQVSLLMLFALIGFLLCRFKKADSRYSKLLSTLEYYIFLPATVFNTFSNNFNPVYLREKYFYLLVSAVILILSLLLSRPISRLLSKDAYQRNLLSYSIATPNYGYFGLALASGLYGETMLMNVLMFALPITCFTSTLGYCMLTKTPLRLKKLLNPIMLAALCGAVVGFCGMKLPGVALSFLGKAAGCMSPVGLLLTGMVISEYKLGELLRSKAVYAVALLRLVLIPAAVMAALLALKLESIVLPAVLVTAMPCGLNTIVYPRLIGEDCKTGAAIAFITTLACCATTPFFLTLAARFAV